MPARHASPRLALATCTELPLLSPDDAPLHAAFAAHGIEAVPAVWDDERVDWSGFDGCLVRSTWDYHEKRDAFLGWTRRVEAQLPLWNPAATLAWNSDKSYLRRLGEAGVPTVPTRWLPRGRPVELAPLLAELGWPRAVLKPTVDLGARNLRVVGADRAADQAACEKLLAAQELMLQPFLPSVVERGETSLVYVEGRLAHAVRKRPRRGDFRVQPTWGGSAAAVEPSAAELAVAEAARAQLGEPPLYARVDVVEGPAGESCLIELELIEPLLFLAQGPDTAEALAARIAALL